MSEFSSGKWSVGVNEKYGSYVYVEGSGAIIAVIRSCGYTRQSDDPEEKEAVRQANARLIASAPEMYKLLEIWTQVQAQPTLMDAQNIARKLLACIKGEEDKA